MIPAPTLQDVKRTLQPAFLHRYEGIPPRHLIGILFARPASALVRESILPHLDYLNEEAGPEIDIFFPGYSRYVPNEERTAQVEVIARKDGRPPWEYSDSAFVRFGRELRKETTWRLRHEVSLLLLDATFAPETEIAVLDYSQVVELNILQLVLDRIIASPVDLLLATIHAGKSGSRSVNTFSNERGIRAIFDELVKTSPSTVLSGVLAAWRSGQHFAVHDLRPQHGT